VVNPFDPYVANKDVGDGEQLTLVWHLYNMMASCKVDFELTKIPCYLASIYKPKLTMYMGRKHDNLGVDLELQADGKLQLQVSMIKHLKNVISRFPELITQQHQWEKDSLT